MSITYEELSKHPIMARPAILYAAFAEILPRQPELFGPPASDAGLRECACSHVEAQHPVPNLPSGFKKQFTDALTAARTLLEGEGTRWNYTSRI